MKTRRTRVYSTDELALFARHIARRADHRPKECHHGGNCWVTEGPPAFKFRSATSAGASVCAGCGGSILASK